MRQGRLPAGALLADSASDGKIRPWDAATGVPAGIREPGSSASSSPEGERLPLDLAPHAMDCCAILRQVWTRVPGVRERNEAVRRPPPEAHPCRP